MVDLQQCLHDQIFDDLAHEKHCRSRNHIEHRSKPSVAPCYVLIDGLGHPTISDKPVDVIFENHYWSQLKWLMIHLLRPQVLFGQPQVRKLVNITEQQLELIFTMYHQISTDRWGNMGPTNLQLSRRPFP